MKGATVAYPGRDGAHAATACDRLFVEPARVLALPSFTAVAEATVSGEVEFGVLPIESTLVGPIAETHDLLQATPLTIVSETVLRVRHCLLGTEQVTLEEIKVVRSHPAALDQCRRLLAAMPWGRAKVSEADRSGVSCSSSTSAFPLNTSTCARRTVQTFSGS